MKVLITGGAGYIGSATTRALEEAGHEVVILDSLVTGQSAFVSGRPFYAADIADLSQLRAVKRDHSDIDAVIHMAARVVVADSVRDPGSYYRENVGKSVVFFDWLAHEMPVPTLFSSSASVYAAKASFEVHEDDALDPQSPYARTKAVMEQALSDICAASDLDGVSLRYFNPIGAGPDLTCGVHVRKPSHVLGQLVLVASGAIPSFHLTGTDLPTRDGSGLRDFVHVWDVARAHVRALERFDELRMRGGPHSVVNVGTGSGVTVRELVAAFEEVTGWTVPVVESDPRPGDVVGAYANVDRARDWLAWEAQLSLHEGIDSAMAWARRRQDVLGYP